MVYAKYEMIYEMISANKLYYVCTIKLPNYHLKIAGLLKSILV